MELLLKVKMELRMKIFNICAFIEKSDFQTGDFAKNSIKRRDCIKKGAWKVCRFNGGGGWGGGVKRKRGWTNLNLKGKGRPFLEGPENGATL